MQLTPNQIEKIQTVLRQRGASKYLEILLELTDDVASDVEQRLQADPSLDFDRALEASMGRYHRQDLQKLNQQKTLAMQNKYQRMHWRLIRPWFQLPRLMLTLVFVVAMSGALLWAKQTLPKTGALIVILSMMLLPLFRIWAYALEDRAFKKANRRRLLVLSQHAHQLNFLNIALPLIYMPNLLADWFWEANLAQYSWYWVYQAVIFVYLWLAAFVAAPQIYQASMEEARRIVNMA